MFFDDFLSRVKKGDEPRLVLLFGDSESVIAEGFQTLKDRFKKDKPGGTLQAFEGGEKGLTEIISVAQTPSLFAASQLLVLKNAEKSLGGRSEGAVRQLQDYCADPNPDTTLVFLAPGLRKTAKVVTAFERLGWAVQCSDIPDWKLAGWIRQQAQQKGITVGDEGAQILVQKVGNDLAYLKGALDQLATFVYPRKSVTPSEVMELPTPGMESEIFPFLDAVGLRQTDKALGLMAQLADGVDTGTLMMLYGRVRELLVIALGRAKGWSQAEAAETLGMHPFRLKSLWEQATQFSPGELKLALVDLIHWQAGVVTGRLAKNIPAMLLEWWVLKWTRRQGQGTRAKVQV